MSQTPYASPGAVVLRLLAFVLVCSVFFGAAQGASLLRERYVYAPVCQQVCGTRGMRYEGVRQHRKSDSAAACLCVGPDHERADVPTRFFSENLVVDFVLREATSSLGVIFGFIFGVLFVVTFVAVLLRKRASAAQRSAP